VVSVAIENARLFEESQRVLTEAQYAFTKTTLEAWRQMATKRQTVGFTLSGTSVRPLEKPLKSAEIRKAIKTGKTTVISTGKTRKKNEAALVVPIKLREQVIGTMNISLPEDREWDPDEIDIAQALAERVGVAVENATLLEESRRRAATEGAISDITAKISASAEVERIMQVTVGELREALGASEVSLKI
jgi:transcriptional regulator with GAF, ATPase, and Fis domain